MVKHKNAAPRRVRSDDSGSESSQASNRLSPGIARESPSPPGSAERLDQYSKPMIERRRRARINEHLSQLKLLIMEDLAEQPGRLSKLDKAEILEMAVRYLKKQRNKEKERPRTPVSSAAQLYGAGVTECMWVAHHALSQDNRMSPEARIRFLDHMAGWMHRNAGSNFQEVGFLDGAPWSPEHETSPSGSSMGKWSPLSNISDHSTPNLILPHHQPKLAVNEDKSSPMTPDQHLSVPVRVNGQYFPIATPPSSRSTTCDMNIMANVERSSRLANVGTYTSGHTEVNTGHFVPSSYITGGSHGSVPNVHPAFPHFRFMYAPQFLPDVNSNLPMVPGHVISPNVKN